ncbi:MAG TPA: hypothetical protein VIK62_02145 [Verrucomicrobiae bacterium]
MSDTKITRPQFREALAAWRELLAARNLPAEPLWIFAENLCFEPSRAIPGSLRVGFQTRFTTPADDALEIAYDQFAETDARMVFYRLGSSPRGSVCILLCDDWFAERDERDGFKRRDDWGISFYTGVSGDIEEIADLTRWVRRVKRNYAFRDFDFAMSLATIDEIKIHGRTLQPYERFAETMLNRLRRMLGNPT